jgi:hypothetical protein
MKFPLTALRVWEGNYQLYNAPTDDRLLDLANDIAVNGLLEPLVISQDGTIISGNTRFKACKYLGMESVEVRVLDVYDGDVRFAQLAKSFNNHRRKTDAEIFREFDLVELTPEQYQQAYKTSEANFDIYEGAIVQRKDFTKYDQPLIDAIQNIIKNSEYTLTLRAVHYKLLNYGVKIQRDQHKYSNKPKDYAYLSVVATKMRVFGVIPFHNLTDNTRKIEQRAIYQDATYYTDLVLENLFSGYFRNLLQTQDRFYAVVCEKETMSGALDKFCATYGLPCGYMKGSASIDSIYKLVRMNERNGSKPLHLFILTDFDPAGIEIQDSLLRILERDFRITPTYTRVGITQEQVIEYKLPPDVDVKLSDTRAKKFITKYKTINAYELEAMDTGDLMRILNEAVLSCIDIERFNHEHDEYTLDINKLNVQKKRVLEALKQDH